MQQQDTPYTTVINSPNDKATFSKEFHIVPCPQCPPMHEKGVTFVNHHGRFHVKGCPVLLEQQEEK